MTEQEIINKVWNFMKAQGGQSIDKKIGMCTYRGEGGKMCAVGCLLKDSEFDPRDNSFDVTRIDLPPRLAPHVDLLVKLQNAHDNSDGDFWPEFSVEVREIAEYYGLTVPEAGV